MGGSMSGRNAQDALKAGWKPEQIDHLNYLLEAERASGAISQGMGAEISDGLNAAGIRNTRTVDEQGVGHIDL